MIREVSMPYIIFVKHSLPEINPQTPSSRWSLSEEGDVRCTVLADQLAFYQPDAIFSSREPKAIRTAELVAERLSLSNKAVPGLHEHQRENAPFFNSRSEFQGSVNEFFEKPGELVFGEESATQAQERFSLAIHKLLSEQPAQNPVIVAHGTVITLFVAKYNPIEPYPFWLRLGLPSFVTLEHPSYKLKSVVERVST